MSDVCSHHALDLISIHMTWLNPGSYVPVFPTLLDAQ